MGVVQLKIFTFPLAAIVLGFGMGWAIEAPKKKAAPKAAVKKAPVSKAGTKSAGKAPVRSRTASYSRGRTRGRSPQPVAQRRVRGQQSPTTDRYMEIQQALVARGYLQTPPSGTWDTATVDALKRFQEEQNLPPTGKITSLSLIALGLGPKRNPLTAGAQAPPPTQPQTQLPAPLLPPAATEVP